MVLEKFEMKHFFLIGIIAFSLTLASSFYSLILFWDKAVWIGKASAIGMLFFYLALVIVFYKQYKTAKNLPNPLKDNEMDEIIGRLRDNEMDEIIGRLRNE